MNQTAQRQTRLAARATPCVGICSTTYGDLVCRGCKRFAHEITGWNGYDESQRDEVRARLKGLLAGAVRTQLRFADPGACAAVLKVPIDDPDEMAVAFYEALRIGPHSAALEQLTGEAALLVSVSGQLPSMETLKLQIEAEFLARSKAAYERSFKVSLD